MTPAVISTAPMMLMGMAILMAEKKYGSVQGTLILQKISRFVAP